jgi:hypothetical protein
VGVTVSYLFANIPPSFAIMTTATLLYAAAFTIRAVREPRASTRRAGPLGAPVAARPPR